MSAKSEREQCEAYDRERGRAVQRAADYFRMAGLSSGLADAVACRLGVALCRRVCDEGAAAEARKG